MNRNMSALSWIAFILVIIGALNWGLVGALSFDLVAALFGPLSPASRIVYVLVGIAGIYLLFDVVARRNRVVDPMDQEAVRNISR
ncbi:MAG: DUF378 domain-containing protein [Rhodanobacteraceae bacterium]